MQCVLQSSSFKFTVIQPCDPKSGDLQLKVEKQTFSSQDKPSAQISREILPIWLFWYRPDLQLLQTMQTNQQGRIVCLYFTNSRAYLIFAIRIPVTHSNRK